MYFKKKLFFVFFNQIFLFQQQGLIAIGKVDCDSDNAIAVKYHVNKYPTLKLYRHGVMTKREYRGARFGILFFFFS